MQKYFSHGKLLITGEYVVLDGATALALPTKKGQSLEVEEIDRPVIEWRSLDHNGETWFEIEFSLKDIFSEENKIPHRKDLTTEERLTSLLKTAVRLESPILSEQKGFKVITSTDFPLDWGLGTSSTLVANISKWLQVDPFDLLESTFGGSGYDVAVAMEGKPITYQIHGDNRSILTTSYDPEFNDSLFFVHLNKKQNSRDSINYYRSRDTEDINTAVEKISSLTHQAISCTSLSEFELLLEIHENIISQLTGLKKVKTELFPDYPGAIKSLGGWGGDFCLVTGDESKLDYFRSKSYNTIIPYKEMIL
ncbi:GYDIA family GHMP kinase [Salinimicrobium soli]|uniref:GYDIA family GHMP kinase n=1 Tax=Salinimicrobium soli TaxID=1254399 RepID=UPI003AB03C73